MAREQVSSSSYDHHLPLSLPGSAEQTASENFPAEGAGEGETKPLRPPRLLLTLLGDYWWQHKESLPSAALVALLGEFGVSETAARAALTRLVHHDLLVTARQGRQTFYRLSERAAQILDDGVRRIFSFGVDLPAWDGLWSVVAFSIPEENRRLRHVLRDQLRWLGFAPLYDGLWISPRDTLREAAARLADLSIGSVTLFRSRVVESTPDAGLPQRAWDLAALRGQYQQFIATSRPLSLRMKDGLFSPTEALKTRTRIMDSWRRFPASDPNLPDELLPPDWPRASARQLFIEIYDELGALAHRRVQQIIAHYNPELAKQTSYHRSDVWLVVKPGCQAVHSPDLFL